MMGADRPLRVLVWNEGVHEQVEQAVAERYPSGIHGAIADALRERLPNATVSTATLAEPEHGLTEAALANTDVLLWWGHVAHEQVADEVVARVKRHVLAGMGLLVLHSAHFSKIFISLMATSCSLQWRDEGERELVWCVNPTHPIAAGVPFPIVIDEQETYAEYFDIPTPDELVFVSSFSGGEIFRSGATFRRGRGKIFYFSPGDQSYPVYHHRDVQTVLANGVRWAASETGQRESFEVKNPERDWFLQSAAVVRGIE
jgi:trehalose utilization protein